MSKDFNQVEPLKVITVDEKPYVVDELPDNVKELVDVYNTFRQSFADERIEMIKLEYAMSEMTRRIVTAIRESEEGGETAEGETAEASQEAEA